MRFFRYSEMTTEGNSQFIHDLEIDFTKVAYVDDVRGQEAICFVLSCGFRINIHGSNSKQAKRAWKHYKQYFLGIKTGEK